MVISSLSTLLVHGEAGLHGAICQEKIIESDVYRIQRNMLFRNRKLVLVGGSELIS